MMHQDKLVFAVKAHGKVLREFKDTVYIPFASEYTLYIKNLNSVRCQVLIEIDGKSVSDMQEYIVPANGSLEIERFLKKGELNAGNRFKFIERTANIENHKGIGAEDGLIRVQYEFEKPPMKIDDWIQKHQFIKEYQPFDRQIYNPIYRRSTPYYGDIICGSTNDASIARGMTDDSSDRMTFASAQGSNSIPASVQLLNQIQQVKSANEAGITVEGSKSTQKFYECAGLNTDGIKHVMVLKLLGETEDNKPVQKAITVKHKPTCKTCGRVNKATNKFCSDCGTSLEIFN